MVYPEKSEEKSAQQDVMARFGDGLPYERERIVHEARFYMAQSAEAMLEAGKRLIILKENEPHGSFLNIVTEQLGLVPKTAHRMMKAALKYLSPSLQSKMTTLSNLGKAKLYELMLEDDEDLAELAEGGTIVGLTLDDVDRMSVRELRAAIRQSRQKLKESENDLNTSRQMVAEREEKIQKLTVNKLVNNPLDAEGIRQLRDEIGLVEYEIKALLMTRFREGVDRLASNSGDILPHAEYIAGLLNDIELEITLLRDDFALPRHALIDPVPAWAKDDIEADNGDYSASARPEKQINQDEVEDV
ncbi:DUF3102 domain-containing protein [Arsenophonus sp. ENCA]|uniref:DUF3102 domain-containing protein n=1 Tax=Arsenophonus sp. ENCA TaxID=1987579 RepID=UPI0025B85221|nr:DUF3102 domain-containing protein [Arsenophonus sp. ENCA]